MVYICNVIKIVIPVFYVFLQKNHIRVKIAKPFIKWVGGKGQLLPTLEKLLPPELNSWKEFTYIEPFIGGGAMLFFMLRTFGNIKRAVINDLNPDLINAYNTVKNMPSELVERLVDMENEYLNGIREDERKDYYLSVREKFNTEKLSDVENTACLIFLNKTCFNGLYRVNSKGAFNVPFGSYKHPTICDSDTIYADSELLQKVDIISGDFEQSENYLSDKTFVYFDPPYRPLDATSNFNSYSKEKFNDDEQIRLKKYFDRLSAKGCMLMLSNSDCKGRNPEDTFFDDLYKDYVIERVYATRSVNANPNKRGKLTELLIRNYSDKGLNMVQCQEKYFQQYYEQNLFHETV